MDDDGINDSLELGEAPEGVEIQKYTLVEEHLQKKDLVEIKKAFDRCRAKGLKKADFRSRILGRILDFEMTDEEYELLFRKLDFEKTEMITWDEFISYLMLELDTKMMDATTSMSIEPPIIDDPIMIKSHHRTSAIHFTFSPSVLLDGTINYDNGKYLSMSKDGCLNLWNLDLKHLRSYRDKSLFLSLRGTWVTNFACLPDLNILVTSSTERELRFYDTTSKRFNLILALVVMPFCVNHIHYHFTENARDESILICGDLGGHVRVMQFPKEERGPFKQNIGVDYVVMSWNQVAKGKLKNMRAFNVLDIHSDWVKEVSYYKLLGSFVSCSSSPKAMYIGDHCGFRNSYTFVLKRGIETFCLNEDTPMIVTGSLDCVLRLWNPFITAKPVSCFRGHHSSIVKIFLQEKGRLIFSLDKDMTVKVWETSSQTCIQTYANFSMDSSQSKDFCAYYNERNHLLIVGGTKLAAVFCGRVNDELRSDGKTHSGKVTVVTYNRLFRFLITCGMDSNIVTWDLWKNRAIKCIRMAHSYSSMGVKIPLPITAATLDPSHQYLLTGSSDGSIKMWDFNTGLCLRNMSVGEGEEITKLIWLRNKILAVGWHRRVVEFSDSLKGKVTTGKDWELRHSDDITAADFRPGQAIATGTYNGDLIFWKLETGQSYKRYDVTYPTGLFKLKYVKSKDEKKGDTESVTSKSARGGLRTKKEKAKPRKSSTTATTFREPKASGRDLIEEDALFPFQRKLTVHCLLFLRSREMLPDQATLLTATENGMIQAWSHHPSGRFLQAFKATHGENDYVSTMVTDPENEFLFTGTLHGYIKVWLMKNFCLTQDAQVKICMPQYRLQFPFLIKDRIWTRAKFAVRFQSEPLLLSSYKGHLGGILVFEYIPESRILFSGSVDNTVRLWTLSGRYLGTLGQTKPWPNLRFGIDPEKINNPSEFRVPPDLKRKGSYTTLKVLTGAPPIVTKKYDVVVELSVTDLEKKRGVYGKPSEEPHLGHYHKFLPKLVARKKVPPLDETTINIPVFVHLKVDSWEPVRKMETPKEIANLENKVYQNGSTVTEISSV